MATATAAVAAFAKASIDTGMQFDSSMSQVAATMGTTVDQIQELRDFAMDMGAKTAFSATQAADALNYMALAGYDAEQSMEALPNVLNLAAAGGIDLAAASDMVTDAQSALGLSMEESAALVDKMAMASSKSNTSVAQLGDAILTIGGTAKNLAGGTTELSTALGILADNGIKGAEGGTALRNIILSLSAPTDTAAKAMRNLGLEVYDADGNMRPLNKTFGDLEAVLSTMTQGEQTEVLNTIFNKVDLKSVNALLANTGERFDELSEYIDNATGAAEAMANTQLDNLTGDITLMKSALEGAQIVLSDQLTPSLRGLVQFGTSGITQIADAFKEGGLSGAMEAFGAVLSDGLNMVIEVLPQATEAGMQLLGAVGQGLIDNLPVITDAALQIVTMLTTGIIEALPEIATSAVEIITSLANGISEQLPTLVPVAVEAVLQLVETLTDPDSLDNMVDAAIQLITSLADGIINALPTLIAKAPVIVSNLVTAIVRNVPKLLEVAAQIVAKLATGIIDNLPEIGKAAGEIVTTIVFGVDALRQKILEVGVNIIKGIWSGITSMGSWLTEKVTGFFGGLVDGIKNTLGIHSPSTVAEDIFWNFMRGAGNGFEKGEGGLLSTVDSIIDDVMGRFNEMDGASFRLGGVELGNIGTGSIKTASVSFQDSALGLTNAATINAMSGGGASPVFQLTANLVTPDGKVMAEYIADPLTEHMEANGTPIVNPKR